MNTLRLLLQLAAGPLLGLASCSATPPLNKRILPTYTRLGRIENLSGFAEAIGAVDVTITFKLHGAAECLGPSWSKDDNGAHDRVTRR